MNDFKIQFKKYIDQGEFISIDSKNIKKVIDYIISNNIRNIFINKHFGFEELDLEFLKDIPLIEKISIETPVLNISGLKYLSKLNFLWIVDEIQSEINLSCFENIKTLGITWSYKVKGLSEINSLENLSLIKFNFSKSNFNSLSNLKKVSLNQSQKLVDLNFLEYHCGLEIFEVFYSKSLSDIKGLNHISSSLENLQFDHCSNINSWEILNELKKIKKLIISDSTIIPNLNFLSNMNNITHFSFVGTDVQDGNLDNCIGIKYVGFNNKKIYNHTFEELNPNWGKK